MTFSYRMIAAVVLLAFGLSAAAAVGWQFFGRNSQRDQTSDEEKPADRNREKPTVISQNSGDILWNQVDEIRAQTERLEAELRQPIPPSASNDAGKILLNQAHQHLEKLERELGPSRP